MADVTKISGASLASVHPPQHCQIGPLTAGEAIAKYDLVYIKAADGKVYKSTGAAATAPANVMGIVPEAYASGDKHVTIYAAPITVEYGSGLSPGDAYYLSGATAGALADAASTGGTAVVAFAVDATRIRFVGPSVLY